jgi:hypothetical protein
MEDADERKAKLGILSLWAGSALLVAAASIGGPLAVVCGVIGGMALVTGLITALAPGPSDDGEWQAPGPPEDGIGTAVEPQQAISMHVPAPKSVQRWLERVERSAEADAAKPGR